MNSTELPKPASKFSCVFCGYSHGNDAFSCCDTQGKVWTWKVCDRCGTYSLNPTPSEDDLKLAYKVDYYGKTDGKFNGLSGRFLSNCRRNRASRMAKMLRNQSNASVLDVGCGNGEFLGFLSEFGDLDLWGTELEGPASERAKRVKGVRLRISSLEVASFEASSFDMITLFHVFEHLPNPSSTLQLLYRLLKPDGVLIMSFPNIASYQARRFGKHWLHLDPPRHIFLMPPLVFEKAADFVGFKVVRRSFFSIEQNPYGMIQSFFNLIGFPRDFLYERLKGNEGYASKIGKGWLFVQKCFAAISFPFAILCDIIESCLMKNGATVEYILRKENSNRS